MIELHRTTDKRVEKERRLPHSQASRHTYTHTHIQSIRPLKLHCPFVFPPCLLAVGLPLVRLASGCLAQEKKNGKGVKQASGRARQREGGREGGKRIKGRMRKACVRVCTCIVQPTHAHKERERERSKHKKEKSCLRTCRRKCGMTESAT